MVFFIEVDFADGETADLVWPLFGPLLGNPQELVVVLPAATCSHTMSFRRGNEATLHDFIFFIINKSQVVTGATLSSPCG